MTEQSTQAVLAGPDRGIGDALDEEGATVTRIDEEFVNNDALTEAGIDTADLYVLTDASESTSIPLAREQNEDLRIVLYTPESTPEFASAVIDLSVDPELLEPTAVAEELV